MRRPAFRPCPTIAPCLPKPAKEPPAGPGWIHEIKHDGFRILARRNGDHVQLYTRHGTNFTDRFPRIVEAIKSLPVQSCFIDGEAIVVDLRSLSTFDLLRSWRHDHAAVLCAFDLIELDGKDFAARPLRAARVRWPNLSAAPMTELPSTSTLTAMARSSSSTPARSAAKASSRSGSVRTIGQGGSTTGSKSKTRRRRR